ncbi:MAG TPA: hypothetical protein VLE21_04590 [Candidatus Nitrosocosmicus sp.]|nr:hypothetical protein [Candidatus Nitrosocosmicus sp.]
MTDHSLGDIVDFSDASQMTKPPSNQIAEFEKWNCGNNTEINSNFYVKEIKIPENCSIPISIAFDEKDNKVWFIGTKNGTLFEYNPLNQTFNSYKIPIWFSRDLPIGNSWSWDLTLDNSGNNIWFTDEKLNSIWRFDKNSKEFDQFIVPFYSTSYSTSYPVSIDFIDDKNLYLVGIRSLSLWHGNVDEMTNGTSEGFTEIPIPLNDLFTGIPEYQIGLGALAIDKAKKNIWITALAFDKKGVLIKYDIMNKKFNFYELPDSFRSPTGITLDSNDTIWITDHATSSFYEIPPPKTTGKLTASDMEHIVTSPLSSRIYGIEISDVSNKSINDYQNSLPYWIKAFNDGTVFTNEHVGNKIARYFSDNDTMVEYWIPSQNIVYSRCDPNITDLKCGYSNALQFDVEPILSHNINNHSSRIWFTEQSENKIGYVDLKKPIPISLTVSPSHLNIHNKNNNETFRLDIKINPNYVRSNDSSTQSFSYNNDILTLKPVISSTFTPNGDLHGLKATIKPEILYINPNLNFKNSNTTSIGFSILLKPITSIPPGNYNLMVGVESHYFTIMKKLKLSVIN